MIMKIFAFSSHKGLFLILNDYSTLTGNRKRHFSTRIFNSNWVPEFGKLTLFCHEKQLNKEQVCKTLEDPDQIFDLLKFYEEQHERLRVCDNGKPIENHKDYWNYVCHHIGMYRKYGARAINDAWKLQVCGLNIQKYKKLINKNSESLNKGSVVKPN